MVNDGDVPFMAHPCFKKGAIYGTYYRRDYERY